MPVPLIIGAGKPERRRLFMSHDEYKLFELNSIAKYGIVPLTGCLLTPIATKALLYLIWKCNLLTPGVFDMVGLPISELCEALGYYRDKNRNFTHNMKKVCDVIQTVMSRPFKIYLDNGLKYVSFAWIQTVAVDYQADYIRVRFNTDLGGYFGQELKKSFTVVKLKYLNRLTTSAAVILYPFFCRYRSMECFNYSIPDLTILLTGKQTCDYKHLKRNYLTPAILAINSMTDIHISFKENKDGRKVSSLAFTVTEEPGLLELECFMDFYGLKPDEVGLGDYDEAWKEAREYSMAQQKYIPVQSTLFL